MRKKIIAEKEFFHKVSIAGKQLNVLRKEMPVDQIVLDPENPRIGYWTDNQIKKEFSQDEVAFALREKSDDINKLKLNIEVSEGILNPIWVYKNDGGFSVIDGNTRVIIFRDLKKKYPNNENYKKIPCEILPENIDEVSKNFIRLNQHLRGANDWEVYERARMLYVLWQKRGYTEEELENQTKLNKSQIRKWIEAYKNMTEQFLPKYGQESDALNKFSYFVEYENPKIKQGMVDVGLSIKNFCEWIGKGDIKRAQDVRNLRKIFENNKTKEALAKRGYAFAMEELSVTKPGVTSKLFESIEDVIEGLKNMTIIEEEEIVDGANKQKQVLAKELYKRIGGIVKKMKK